MTTKIISGKSHPQNGVISQLDLNRIVQDYENFVDIQSSISRKFLKSDSFTIPLTVMDNLLNTFVGTEAERNNANIIIKMAITLPEQMDCKEEVDISNRLTIVVLLEKDGIGIMDQPGHFIITPGFKEFSEDANGSGECCSQIKPPPKITSNN